MSDRARRGNRQRSTGRVTPSTLRRTAVIAMDGVLAVGTGALAGLFATGTATATVPTPGWTGLQSPVPSGLDTPATDPEEAITTDACATAVSCAAAGDYSAGSSTTHGFLDMLSGGTWSSVEAPMPSDAATDPDPQFYDMDCATSGSCVTVGEYKNSSGREEGLIETLSGGVWTATEAPTPSDAEPAATADTWLKSASCPAPGSCEAVGFYANTASHTVGLIETLSGGQWTATPAPQVSDADTNNGVDLEGISCPAVGSCEADGLYATNAGGRGLELLSLSGGTWTPSVAALPSDAATGSSQIVDVNPDINGFGQSLSCVGTVCDLAGEYATTTSGTAPLLLHLSGATWTTSPLVLPGNASTGSSEDAPLLDVSCGFDSGCVAVGDYSSSTGGTRPLVASVTAGGTVTAQEAPQPSDAASGSSVDSVFFGVSCLSSTDCAAVGAYANTGSSNLVGMIDTLSGTTWTSQLAPVPANAATGTSAASDLFAVACTARSSCVAGGDFLDPGNEFGLLDTYTPPEGYWTDASDGGVFGYGSALFHGSTGNIHLNKPVVGMAAPPGNGGYWEVASDGGVFSFGNALFHGSAGNIHLNKPVVGMAATPDGNGYWLVASDGGVFTYGDALFHGSTGNLHLNQPVVGMAATPDGGGYWLVASDGGVFSFGDAVFYGSTGGIHLNKPVVGMASSATGHGYWLVASDGGVFSFGDALFHGSAGAIQLNKPVVGMMSTFDGAGYWLVASDGGVFSYGDAGSQGSAGNLHLVAPMVGGAAP